MKETSIQVRFLLVVLSAILSISIFVGGLSIYHTDAYVRDHTQEFVEVTCENEAIKINDTFKSMEKSVRIMANYVLTFFRKASDIEDRNRQNIAIQYADEMFLNVVKDTEDVVAYYFRLNPDISDNTAGIFYSAADGGDKYESFTPADLSLFEKDDIERVGWYWLPYEAGEPIWMTPYHNQNIDVLMISYVVPLYVEGEFLGVLGMDFDYKILTQRVHEIKIFENGFAHLELDHEVIHDTVAGDDCADAHDATKYLSISRDLINGMTLVLSADYDDIWKIRYNMALSIIFSILFFTLVFSLLVIFMVRRIVRPLKKLTDASIRLSSGDYDVKIDHSNVREIKLLSGAFENMITNLREHKNVQHRLAHYDSLTGLRNTTSYKAWVAEFDKEIKKGGVSFGVAVLDINNLKELNDTHGHVLGNELIIAATKIICAMFKRSPVFRIGGDEFCAILQNQDLEDKNALLASFDYICATAYVTKDNVRYPVSIAKGFSEFDPEKDTCFADVFMRADNEMYKNKRDMKMAHK